MMWIVPSSRTDSPTVGATPRLRLLVTPAVNVHLNLAAVRTRIPKCTRAVTHASRFSVPMNAL